MGTEAAASDGTPSTMIPSNAMTDHLITRGSFRGFDYAAYDVPRRRYAISEARPAPSSTIDAGSGTFVI
jgi:hypothetical protein